MSTNQSQMNQIVYKNMPSHARGEVKQYIRHIKAVIVALGTPNVHYIRWPTWLRWKHIFPHCRAFLCILRIEFHRFPMNFGWILHSNIIVRYDKNGIAEILLNVNLSNSIDDKRRASFLHQWLSVSKTRVLLVLSTFINDRKQGLCTF